MGKDMCMLGKPMRCGYSRGPSKGIVHLPGSDQKYLPIIWRPNELFHSQPRPGLWPLCLFRVGCFLGFVWLVGVCGLFSWPLGGIVFCYPGFNSADFCDYSGLLAISLVLIDLEKNYSGADEPRNEYNSN